MSLLSTPAESRRRSAQNDSAAGSDRIELPDVGGERPRVDTGLVDRAEAEANQALAEIRQRMLSAFQLDPSFSALFDRPLEETEPEDELLDRLRSGEFRNQSGPCR